MATHKTRARSHVDDRNNAAPAAATSPCGVNIHAPQGPRLAILNQVHGAGIGWVRIDFNWDEIETQQGVFDWRVHDQLVPAALGRGLDVYATLAYTPALGGAAAFRRAQRSHHLGRLLLPGRAALCGHDRALGAVERAQPAEVLGGGRASNTSTSS